MSSQDNRQKRSLTYLDFLEMSFQDSTVPVKQNMKKWSIYSGYIYLITQSHMVFFKLAAMSMVAQLMAHSVSDVGNGDNHRERWNSPGFKGEADSLVGKELIMKEL